MSNIHWHFRRIKNFNWALYRSLLLVVLLIFRECRCLKGIIRTEERDLSFSSFPSRMLIVLKVCVSSIYFSVIFDHNEYSFLHHDYSLWSYMRIMSTHFCIMTSHFGHFLGHNDHLIFPENCHDYSLSPNNQPSWLVIITQ